MFTCVHTCNRNLVTKVNTIVVMPTAASVYPLSIFYNAFPSVLTLAGVHSYPNYPLALMTSSLLTNNKNLSMYSITSSLKEKANILLLG